MTAEAPPTAGQVAKASDSMAELPTERTTTSLSTLPAQWWVPALVMATLAIIASASAWVDLFRIGIRDEEANQVVLAPAIFAWLVAVRWPRRDTEIPEGRSSAKRQASFWIWPVLLVVGWVMSWVGFYQAIQAAWHAGAVLMALSAAALVLPAGMLRRFAPAIGVLIFLIPVPSLIRLQIAFPLQTATAIATEWIMSGVGFDIKRQGNLLVFNGEEVQVAEACNGMRMVFVLVLVSYAAAFATPLRTYARVLLLLLSPVTAIACNVARLAPTVYVYGHHPEFANSFHDVSGWVMIGVSFVLVMAALQLLRRMGIPIYRDEAKGETVRKGQRHVIRQPNQPSPAGGGS